MASPPMVVMVDQTAPEATRAAVEKVIAAVGNVQVPLAMEPRADELFNQPTDNTDFDGRAATDAIRQAIYGGPSCRRRNSPSEVLLAVTFDRSGRVAAVAIKEPSVGKAVRRCITAKLLQARIRPFSRSDSVTQEAVYQYK